MQKMMTALKSRTSRSICDWVMIDFPTRKKKQGPRETFQEKAIEDPGCIYSVMLPSHSRFSSSMRERFSLPMAQRKK